MRSLRGRAIVNRLGMGSNWVRTCANRVRIRFEPGSDWVHDWAGCAEFTGVGWVRLATLLFFVGGDGLV